MQKLHFLAATAVIMGATACPSIDPTDDFADTLLTTVDDDVDDTTEGESESGDATTDESTETGDCGMVGCDCVDSSTCGPGLECVEGTCQTPGIDTNETDTTEDTTDTGSTNESWDPADCPPPAMVLGVGMLEGDFCSNPCTPATAMEDCQPGPQGTAPQCALTTMGATEPSFCALVCMPAMDACPMGSTCKDLMDPMNPGLGLCTYP